MACTQDGEGLGAGLDAAGARPDCFRRREWSKQHRLDTCTTSTPTITPIRNPLTCQLCHHRVQSVHAEVRRRHQFSCQPSPVGNRLSPVLESTLLKPEEGEEEGCQVCTIVPASHFAAYVCAQPQLCGLCAVLPQGSGRRAARQRRKEKMNIYGRPLPSQPAPVAVRRPCADSLRIASTGHEQDVLPHPAIPGAGD